MIGSVPHSEILIKLQKIEDITGIANNPAQVLLDENDHINSFSSVIPLFKKIEALSISQTVKARPAKTQNKDHANASRTARIALYALASSYCDEKDFSEILRELKFSSHQINDMKTTVRNMGDKKFKNSLLLKAQLSKYFGRAFSQSSKQAIKAFQRSNKNSKLGEEDRIELVMESINNYEKVFKQQIIIMDTEVCEPEKAQNVINEYLGQVIVPIPLPHDDYIRYMEKIFPGYKYIL